MANACNLKDPSYNYDQDVVLVFDGNSLTKGTAGGGGNEQHYPNVVKNYFTGKFNSIEFYSFGEDGKTLFKMRSDMGTDILPRVVAGKTNFIIAWEDVNGMLATPAQHYTAQEQWDAFNLYFQQCKDAGYDIGILITGYYPREHDVTPEQMAERNVFLNRVLDTPLSEVPWDYHIDLREAPHIGGPQGQLLNKYFADRVHLEPAGYNIVAEMVIEKIKEIIEI